MKTQSHASVEKTVLFDRIHGSMLASAIGDAMGGPVEGWHYERIVEEHGIVDTLLPYSEAPRPTYQFSQKAIDHCYQKRKARCAKYVGYLDEGDILILAVGQESPEEAAQEHTLQAFGTDEEYSRCQK